MDYRKEYAELIVADLATIGEVLQGDCKLKVEGDRYVMTKTSGRLEVHSLDVSCTDPMRLLAHWEGYTGRELVNVRPLQMAVVGQLRPGAFSWWDNPNPRRGW